MKNLTIKQPFIKQNSMKKLILAIDSNDKTKIKNLVATVGSKLAMLKIGHITMSSFSKDEILDLCGEIPIMLDLKFHDIKNTVINAIKNYTLNLPKIEYFTYHGTADKELILHIAKEFEKPIGIAVLLLSSSQIKPDDFMRLATINYDLGIRHFVCPGLYLTEIRSKYGNKVKLFTPGIRNFSNDKDCHIQTITTHEAIKLGADFMIVGRPLLNTQTPNLTIQEYL